MLGVDKQQCFNGGMTTTTATVSPSGLVDALGQVHAPAPDARIVCLVPSITELLCDLGLAGKLVGRTGFCIHPRDVVATIPKVGGTKDVNIEKIRRLAPTHVVVNIDENEKPTVDRLAEFVPHIVVTHPNALRALPSAPARTVLYCIWQDPWMTVSDGTYIAAMLAELGWRVPDLGLERYPRFAWSQALVDGLDAVLLSTEPYRFTEAHADALEKQIGIPVLLVDGEMMSWYGSRALAGLRHLRNLAVRLDGQG